MPPFKLEALKPPLYAPIPSSIITMHEFGPRVKMPGWNIAMENEPKDNNPYCPPGGNQFLSTYRRMGIEENEDHYCSTTTKMLEQVKLKEKLIFKPDNQQMISFLTVKTSCTPVVKTNVRFCAPEFTTTMQDSYPVPYPCILPPLSMPKTPFLQNRKLKWEDEVMSSRKGFDECYLSKLKKYQKIKSFRTISYDPIQQLYSDGSSPEDERKKRKCFPLNYADYKD